MSENVIQEQMLAMINQYFANKNQSNQKAYAYPAEETYHQIDALTIPKQGRDVEKMLDVLNQDVFPYRIVGEHQRNFAFVPAPVEDVSKLGDILTTLYNPNAAGWFSAPVVAYIHKQLIEWFCGKVGYGEKAGGVFVSGGSVANMTALIAARDAKLSLEEITKGVAYVSDQAHHSVNKGLRMIGILDTRVRRVPTDAYQKIIPVELEKMIQADKENGLIPFVAIGTAGTTNAGTIDPLDKISQVCQKYNLWFHVDGAFGASTLMSPKYAPLLKGVEEADSVIWDAHKWLFQTYTCAMVLVKEKQHLLNSFSDDPSYLKDAHNGDQIESWDLGPELSRPAMGIKLWLTLQVLGTEKMAKNIEHNIELAQSTAQLIEALPNWEIVTPAQLAMVTFRYMPEGKSEEERDQLNVAIAQEIQASGWANVLTTEIKGHKVIRICTISPNTTEKDMGETIEKLVAAAKKLG